MCLRYKRFGLFTLLIGILAIFSLQLESKVSAADNRYCPDNPRNLTRNPTMDGGHGTRFGTVANEWEPFIYEGDAPHFTYLGHGLDSLAGLGLRRVKCICGQRVYDFWTPDVERLLYSAHFE